MLADCPSTRLQVPELPSTEEALFMESYDSRHSSHSFTSKIASKLELVNPPLRLDSQCKYGLLARGDGNIFMRFPAETYRYACPPKLEFDLIHNLRCHMPDMLSQ